jgi:hypothetical protein
MNSLIYELIKSLKMLCLREISVDLQRRLQRRILVRTHAEIDRRLVDLADKDRRRIRER